MQGLLKSAQVWPPNKPAPLSSSDWKDTRASCPQSVPWQPGSESSGSLMVPFSSEMCSGGKREVLEKVAPCGATTVARHCSGVHVAVIREDDVLIDILPLASRNVTSSACRLETTNRASRQAPSNRTT